MGPRERKRKEHLEIWKKVVHLRPDKLLLVLPDLTVYNSHATLTAKDMCTLYTGAPLTLQGRPGTHTGDLRLGLAEPCVL